MIITAFSGSALLKTPSWKTCEWFHKYATRTSGIFSHNWCDVLSRCMAGSIDLYCCQQHVYSAALH